LGSGIYFQGHIKLIKKLNYNVTKDLYFKLKVFFNFLFIRELKKCIMISQISIL